MKWNRKQWSIMKRRCSIPTCTSGSSASTISCRKVGELCLLAPTVPEKYGGGGMDPVGLSEGLPT